MRTAEQQFHDAKDSVEGVRRAAEKGYLPQTKDEWQLTILCQLTMAVLTLAMVISGGVEDGED